MKRFFSRLLTVAATCVVLLVAVTVITPKRVSALVATLVRDADTPGRHPFGLAFSLTAGAETGKSLPANEEVVITNISLNAEGSGSNPLIVQGSCWSGGVLVDFIDATIPAVAISGTTAVFSQTFTIDATCDPVTPYPAAPLVFSVGFGGANPPQVPVNISISGYYVTLP